MKRILLAIGVKDFERALQNQLIGEYTIVGEAIYKEAILKGIRETAPDIVIIREKLPGSKDILEILTEIRKKYPNLRIIFVASKIHKIGDKFLALITSYGIYDILIGEVLIDKFVDVIRNPRTFKDALIYMPEGRINENDEPVFKVKEVVIKERTPEKNATILKNPLNRKKHYNDEDLEFDLEDDTDDNFELELEDDSFESTQQLNPININNSTRQNQLQFGTNLTAQNKIESPESFDLEMEDEDLLEFELDESEDEDGFEFEDENEEFILDDSQEGDNDFEFDMDDSESFNEQDETAPLELDISDEDNADEFEIESEDELSFELEMEDDAQEIVDLNSQENQDLFEIDYEDDESINDDSDDFDLEDLEDENNDLDLDLDDDEIYSNPTPKYDNQTKKQTNIFNPTIKPTVVPPSSITPNISISSEHQTPNNLKNIKTFENSKEILNKSQKNITEEVLDDKLKDMGLPEYQSKPKKKNVPEINPSKISGVVSNNEPYKSSESSKSPYKKRMIKRKKNIETGDKKERAISTLTKHVKKQKILTFVSPKIGVGNSQIAFNTALKIAASNSKVLFLEIAETGGTIECLYQLSEDSKGLDYILKGINNFSDDTILKNITSIVDKKRTIDKDNQFAIELLQHFPDNFNYLFFSKGFQQKSLQEKQMLTGEKFMELLTLLLSQYDYEYIIIDCDFDTNNPLLETLLRFSSQLYVTLTQDVDVIDKYINVLKPYLSKKISKNVLKYILLNKEEKISLKVNDISEWIEEPILASLPNMGRIFLESNYKGVPILMHKDEILDRFFDTIAKATITN